jgi:hypothetical protein
VLFWWLLHRRQQQHAPTLHDEEPVYPCCSRARAARSRPGGCLLCMACLQSSSGSSPVGMRVVWARWVTLVCASQATSVTWSFSNSTGVRQPTALWRRCRLWKRSSMRWRRSGGVGDSQGGHAGGPTSSTWTRPTTTPAAAGRCAAAASPQDRPPRHPAARPARPPPRCGRGVAGVAGGSRRLRERYERPADVLLGFSHLACALICRKAQSPSEV